MDQVEEIKNRLSISEVVGLYVKLKTAGRNQKGLCPFHNEKTPSFMVNPELGIYKCFGCGKGGDIFSFIQEVEKVDFPEALQILADKAGIVLKKNENNSGERKEVDEMIAAHEAAVEYYHYLLTKHPTGEPARLYLAQRKISDKLIEEFRIGFALSSWDGLYQYLVLKKKFNPDLLEKAGLLISSSKGNKIDRFRGRIIYPLSDHRGRVVGLAGRVLPTIKQMGEFDPPKYINSPETPIYHKSKMLFGLYQAKQHIRTKDRVVLVEGEMDMISSFASGIGETVAIKGTALTEEQILLLSRLTKNLILSLDADTAGDSATKRSIGLAENQGMNIKVVHISGGKDPDEIARENPNAWKSMLESAVDIYQFYIDSAVAKFGKDTVDAKRKISEEVMPILSKIENKVIQAHYVKMLSRILEVSEETINAEVSRVGKRESGVLASFKTEKETKPAEKAKPREELLTEDLIRFSWWATVGNFPKIKESVERLHLDGPLAKALLLWLSSHPNPKHTREQEIVDFIKSLPDELRSSTGELFMQTEEIKDADRQLEMVLGELEQALIKDGLGSLVAKIKVAEAAGDRGSVKELELQLVRLSKRRD